MRDCGECAACCYVAEVQFALYRKPARTACLHVLPPEPHMKGRCSLFEQGCRPNECLSFECSWKRGLGDLNQRPDKSGVMLSVNDLNGGRWGFVLELEHDAVRTKGSDIVCEFARQISVPVIIASFDSIPPHDTGDRVVVKDELLPRAKQLAGKHLGTLASGISIYELIDRKDDQ